MIALGRSEYTINQAGGDGLPFSIFLSLAYIMVGTWEASTMVNFAELRRDYETLKDTELSKDKIIEACFVYEVAGWT